MKRAGMILMVLFTALPGTACSQGLLDSVFGPSGMGLWGTQSNSFDSPQYYGGNSAPSGQPSPTPAYPQGYGPPQDDGNAQTYENPQGYGQPQQGYYPQWQGYQQPQAAPPQTGYSPAQPQAPQPASQPVTVQVQPQPQGTAAAQQQGPAPVSADQNYGFDPNLPSGAVRITTTTPDGTTVQYYPPSGQQLQQQPEAAPAQPVRRRPSATKPRAAQAGTRPNPSPSPSNGPSSIAMPKPVQIPQGRDPRAGWGPAVNRAPAAPGALEGVQN